jgi:hypothetical protein
MKLLFSPLFVLLLLLVFELLLLFIKFVLLKLSILYYSNIYFRVISSLSSVIFFTSLRLVEILYLNEKKKKYTYTNKKKIKKHIYILN